MAEEKARMKEPVINVIFRACDVVTAVNKQPRPFGLDKPSLIKLCFRSMYHSIQEVKHTITVLGDKLSAETVDFFNQYKIPVINGDCGNDESIRQSLQKALSFADDDWIYFCEDDYLHRPETFRFIANLIKEKESILPERKRLFFSKKNESPALVIFPSDYPDRYTTNPDQHYIFHSKDTHWRQINNTTFTFLMQAKSVKKYKNVLLKASVKANDAYLSKTLYGRNNFSWKALCLSPIPGLTAHMHINTMSPLIDWKIVSENVSG